MPFPDNNNISRMRMDAIRRSQEMHRRSDQDKPDLPPEVSQQSVHRQPADSIQSLLNEITGGKPDAEKMLIAALLFLLIKEGADIKLMLALGYILM